MLLNFAASNADVSAVMEITVSVLIIGTCGPLLLVLVWAVVFPGKADAWAESSKLMKQLSAQAVNVQKQAAKLENHDPSVRGGWRGPRLFAKVVPEDKRAIKRGLQWLLSEISKEIKQRKAFQSISDESKKSELERHKFAMRAAFYCYPMLEREVAKFIRTDGKELEQLLTSAFEEEALLASAFAAAAVATAPAPAVSKVATPAAVLWKRGLKGLAAAAVKAKATGKGAPAAGLREASEEESKAEGAGKTDGAEEAEQRRGHATAVAATAPAPAVSKVAAPAPALSAGASARVVI
jgi:hypothetical protein